LSETGRLLGSLLFEGNGALVCSQGMFMLTLFLRKFIMCKKMCKKLIYLVCFVVVLGLVVDVQAANVDWTDAGPDHLWSTATNWSSGTLPTIADTARIGLLPGPIIANEDVVVDALYVGYGNTTGELTVDGGTFVTSGWAFVGASPGSNGTVNMNSGTITIGGTFTVGKNGSGTLNMTGGTITINGNLQIAQKATGIGHENLDGGIITCNNFVMRTEAGSVGTMDVRAGTLIINGDKLSTVQGYIDNGWITAYDGNGTLHLDYDVTNLDFA